MAEEPVPKSPATYNPTIDVFSSADETTTDVLPEKTADVKTITHPDIATQSNTDLKNFSAESKSLRLKT